MNLGGWGFANPAGLWLAALALPIVAMHILRPRRIQQTVAAVFLWRKVNRPVSAAKPWQRLQPSWLLAAKYLPPSCWRFWWLGRFSSPRNRWPNTRSL